MAGSSGLSGISALNFTREQLSGWRLGLARAAWNYPITNELAAGARGVWLDCGFSAHNIVEMEVPGSFELPLACQWLIDRKSVDAVVALGCLIQGETPHFDYISQAVASGLMQVGLSARVPVAFGVLTVLNEQQAWDRAGGVMGHKGEEATETVLRMLNAQNTTM